MIKGAVLKNVGHRKVIGKVFAVVLILGIAVPGIYYSFSSDFGKWIAMPFQIINQQGNVTEHGQFAEGMKIPPMNRGDGEQKSENGEQEIRQMKSPGNEGMEIRPAAIGKVLLTFGSITLLWAVLSYGLSRLIWRL